MTEELKKAIESAKTDEEKKAVAEKFKDEIMSLSEEDLNNIAGGWSDEDSIDIIYICKCGNCGTVNFFDAGTANRPCRNCGAQCPEYSRKWKYEENSVT